MGCSEKNHFKRFKTLAALWLTFNGAFICLYALPKAGFGHMASIAAALVFLPMYIWIHQALRQLEKQADLRARYDAHESKRHFQVLQSLLFVEEYDEAKAYISSVTQATAVPPATAKQIS